MECDKCKKIYKSEKTLEQHIKKMHPMVITNDNEEVDPDIEPSESKTSDHQCGNCIQCKEDINFVRIATKLLILRYIDLTKEATESSIRNNKNFSITFENFKYVKEELSKLMLEVEFLMNEKSVAKDKETHGAKDKETHMAKDKETSAEKKIIIKNRKSKK